MGNQSKCRILKRLKSMFMSLLNVYSLSQTALGLNTIVAYSSNKHYNKRKVGKKFLSQNKIYNENTE